MTHRENIDYWNKRSNLGIPIDWAGNPLAQMLLHELIIQNFELEFECDDECDLVPDIVFLDEYDMLGEDDWDPELFYEIATDVACFCDSEDAEFYEVQLLDGFVTYYVHHRFIWEEALRQYREKKSPAC